MVGLGSSLVDKMIENMGKRHRRLSKGKKVILNIDILYVIHSAYVSISELFLFFSIFFLRPRRKRDRYC